MDHDHLEPLSEAFLQWIGATAGGGGLRAPLFTRTRTAVPADQVLSRWCELPRRLARPVQLSLLPETAPFLFDEHRFSSVFQSLDLLRSVEPFEGRELSEADHAARVAAMITAARDSAVPEQVIEWAMRILTAANHKRLVDSVNELVDWCGPVGTAIVQTVPSFVEDVVGERGALAHGGGGDLGSPARYWHTEILRWLVRYRLLVHLGFTLDEASRCILENGRFRSHLARLE